MTGEKEEHEIKQKVKEEEDSSAEDVADEKDSDDDTNKNNKSNNENKNKRKADEILEDPPKSSEKTETTDDDGEEEDTMPRAKRQKQEIETTSDGGDEDNNKKNEEEENKDQDDNSKSGDEDNIKKEGEEDKNNQDDNSKSGDEDNNNKNEGEEDKNQTNNNSKGGEEEDGSDVVGKSSSIKVDDDQVKKDDQKDNQDEEQQPKGKKGEGNVDDDDDDVKVVEIENKDTPPESKAESEAYKNDVNNVEGDGKIADTENETTTNAGNDNDMETPKSPDKNNGKINPDVNDKHNTTGNPYDSLKYIMVRNDGKPESLIKLVALKSLFSRQLPKMPRTYIARLVFDRRHTSLVILNPDPATKDTDEEVIGSICYRAFPEMRFAEIAFCAVNASHQVKGYGTKLMNLVKKEGARTGIEYFITYADNYAIGYFKKQGFTKTISMPKGRFQGLIKDYDGGTMMECYVHPSIDFTRIPEMLAAQRKFIVSRIRHKAQSHKVVYDPLPKNWIPHLEGVSRANESAARALAVPGMIEAGWTISDLMATTGQGKDLDRAKNALKSELLGMIVKLEEQQFAWPFREPVDTTEVKDYLTIIKEPIDLLTIDKRVRKGDHYKSRNMLYADLMLMVNNCKLYNEEASTYVQCAQNLETYLKALFAPR
jgi:histone acetyltransferase